MTSTLRWTLATLVLLGCLATLCPAQDTEPENPLAQVEMYRERARKLGAKGTVPSAWSTYDKQVKDARDGSPSAAEIAELEADGRALVARAAYLKGVKDSREPLEELLGRYDQSLREVATLMGLDLDPVLTGDEAAARLLTDLGRARVAARVEADSLRVENRRLNELAEGHVAAQDSIITQLRVELSAVQTKLWETELRAGVAEADRSAAESALSARQQREAQVKQIKADLGAEGGDVLVKADGAIVIQVPGLDFKVGEAHLAGGQGDLMDLLAEIVGRFPDEAVRVEGHTDDTGSRASNLKLSKRRAATVAGGIERRLELMEGSIAVEGFGPDRPVAPNSTSAGRKANRRIDIVIGGGE